MDCTFSRGDDCTFEGSFSQPELTQPKRLLFKEMDTGCNLQFYSLYSDTNIEIGDTYAGKYEVVSISQFKETWTVWVVHKTRAAKYK